ncbi:MAG: RDD family protein [Cyclobacteriaceae bacterium]|nr:RDD family protein [Cyclobacteriaceae bacterium]
MQKVSVRTSHNVVINYDIASIGDRILAILIDLIIIGIYGFMMIMIFITLETEVVMLWIIAYLPIFFYHLVSEIFFEGQSVGKNLMKIKVIRLDGTRPSIGGYILRWILRPVDLFMYGGVAILTIVLNGKGQRLGDLAAATTVIKLQKKKRREVSSPLEDSFNDNYEPVFAEAINLSDQDIDLAKKALEVNRKAGNPKPATFLAEKLCEKMNIKTEVPPIKFLHTIIKDYNHITSR